MPRKKGRDNPVGLTALQVIEDIAKFPLSKGFDYDDRGRILSGSNSYGPGYAAFRNQRFAQQWLDDQKQRKPRP